MKVTLHKNQYEVAVDPHRFKVVCAGRRWGKSIVARMIMLKWATQDEGLYWIVCPTFQQGKDIHWFQGYKKEIPNKYVIKWNDSELSVDIKVIKDGKVVGVSRIQIKSAENPDRLKGVKLRGLIVDEVASMRNWDWIWQEALRPTLTDFRAPAIFISTPKGYDRFYELFNIKHPSYKSFQFTSYDNPHISREEIDEAKATVTEDFFAQEYLADFRKYTGLVYKDFSREMIKEFSPEEFQPVYWIRGCDRGFTNPTALCYIQVDKDDNWYIVDEIYKTKLTNSDLSQLLVQMDEKHSIKSYELSTMDSAQAGDIAELQQLGHDFIPCKKESGEVNKSYIAWKIQKLTARIKRGALFIHPRCVNTIMEFEYYRYPEKKNDLNDREEPEKVNDHCLTGDTLVDTIWGQYPIKELVGKQGFLYSIDGVRVFSDVKKTGENKEIFELLFSNGKKVRCTSDHLFLTTQGWVEAKKLAGKEVIDIGSMELIQLGTYANNKIRNMSGVFRKKILSLWVLLSTRWKKITQGCLESLQWKNKKGNAHSSYRRRQGKQQNRKPRNNSSFRSFQKTLDRGKIKKASRECSKICFAKGNRVAQVTKCKRISQENCKKKLARQGLSQKDMRVLWQGIQNPISNEVKVLLRQMWNEKSARCEKIQSIGFSDVYNLHVDGTRCFSVNGGIIVHNCMDSLGDLNSYYDHFYEIKTDPFKDKIPGTYVKSYPEENNEEDGFEEELNIQDLW